MPRITAIEPADATGKAKDLLNAVHRQLGLTPNLMKTLAAAPAALEGYLKLNSALASGVLDATFREQIALAVAQANACEYCLSAHTALGRLAGLQRDEVLASRDARAVDAKRDAGLKFAAAVVANRGAVSDAAVDTVRAAGFDDAEITEIVGNIALNIYTNYLNQVAQTTIDFPRVELSLGAAV